MPHPVLVVLRHLSKWKVAKGDMLRPVMVGLAVPIVVSLLAFLVPGLLLSLFSEDLGKQPFLRAFQKARLSLPYWS